jgi:hypothetical protein
MLCSSAAKCSSVRCGTALAASSGVEIARNPRADHEAQQLVGIGAGQNVVEVQVFLPLRHSGGARGTRGHSALKEPHGVDLTDIEVTLERAFQLVQNYLFFRDLGMFPEF